jgi:hypothetical protein
VEAFVLKCKALINITKLLKDIFRKVEAFIKVRRLFEKKIREI